MFFFIVKHIKNTNFEKTFDKMEIKFYQKEELKILFQII